MVDVAPSLAAAARAVEASQDQLLKLLTRVETHQTARIELDWVLAALRPPTEKITWTANRRRLGVVFVSCPATLPMYSFVLFAAASAVRGNEVTLRPASASRECVETVSELTGETGSPVRLFSGPWREFAAEARAHADGMVFCGSAEHALRLDQELPDRICLVTQGPGVCAFVVTAEADLSRAARDVVRTRIFNSCQDCMATERVYVAEPVYSDFLAALLREVDRVRLGSNDDEDTDLGPLLLPGAAEQWYSRLPELGTPLRNGQARGDGLYSMAVVEAAADSLVVLDEKYCPILPLVTYRSDTELRDMLALGKFALGLTVYGQLPKFGTLDFAHVAVEHTLYDFEDAWGPFGGYRSTTMTRHGGQRRGGPALVPFEMSEPA